MSVIDAIDRLDKLEFNDTRSFAGATALIAKSIQEYNDNPSTNFEGLQLLFETDSPEIINQQKAIEREWLDNNNEIISFTAILDSCLGQSSNISQQSIYLPFRIDQPIDYEPIHWQTDPSPPTRFIIEPPPSTRILQPRNEPNNDNNTKPIIIDDKDYVDALGDEENAPKITTKKTGKKKKLAAKKIDTSIQLNTSSNRTSTTVHKFPKLSSKLSNSKRISGTSAIRKFVRPSHHRGSHTKPSITINKTRLSQEQRDQLTRAVEERKQEERKRKVEKLHEQAKKREDVLNRAKLIQQDKEQKNQLRISDNQSNTSVVINNKNNSMNESTTYIKPLVQQYKPVILDTTSKKILQQNKILKKAIITNAEYTFVVEKNNPLRNDMTLPSSSIVQLKYKPDWTILATAEDELDMTMTDTTDNSGDGNYGIGDIRSDHETDHDEDDETRIPVWAKERLFQTFWKSQGHWYLSRRTLKLTRRTLGHYPVIKDELRIWLRDLKSNKPLSETFSDATYLDQTQAHFF